MQIICTLFKLDLSDVPNVNTFVCLTDAAFDIEYRGQTYRSFGSLLKIDKVTEENTLKNKGITVTLSGLELQTVRLVNSASFQKQPVTIYKALTNDETNTVQEAAIYYRGITDVPEMAVDYKSNSVTLQILCQSVFDISQTPSLSRALNATHQAFKSGDRFFEYANQTSLTDELWIRE